MSRTSPVQRYTEIVMDYYSPDMITWCNDNIPGYGRLVHPTFYFDVGYSWYARWPKHGVPGMIFSFAREHDAVLFTLKWL